MFKVLRKHKRRFALFVALNLLIEIFSPTVSWALTAGPKSPEFTSFEPVATTDMVNLFSGDYTYNLPVVKIPGGPDGGDYALSLSYHSGEGVEEEASWVGSGWTLNPGAINRSLRGLPDEYDGNRIINYNKTRANWTLGFTTSLGVEFTGVDINLGLSQSYKYNNYMGFSRTFGFNLGFKGIANVGLTTSAGETTVSGQVNPVALVSSIASAAKKKKKGKDQGADEKKNDTPPADDKKKTTSLKDAVKGIRPDKIQYGPGPPSAGSILSQAVSQAYGMFVYNDVGSPSVSSDYRGFSLNLSLSLAARPSQAPIGLEVGVVGSFALQKSLKARDGIAFGYAHNPSNSIVYAGVPTSDPVHSDYMVEKASPFNKRDNFIGIPFNTADNFLLTGEGLSGGFRMYSQDAANYYPNFMDGKMFMIQMGLEVGLGANIGVGFDVGVGTQDVTINDWKTPIGIYQFSGAAPYFRFNNDLGGKILYSSSTALENFSLYNANSVAAVPGAKKYGVIQSVGGLSPKLILPAKVSDGSLASHPAQSSFIEQHTLDNLDPTSTSFQPSFHKDGTAANGDNYLADRVNDSKIQGSLHKYHSSIAEYKITNPDGNTYIYGLPVYSKNEIAVSFGIKDDQEGSISGCAPSSPNITPPATIYNDHLVKVGTKTGPTSAILGEAIGNYGALDQNKSVVGERKDVPYPTTYLMTEVLSTDYIDVTDNGPTLDDFGGWTKFEYKQTAGDKSPQGWYLWRTPYTGLLYQKNQMSEKLDDMGSLNKAEKEAYNLKMIETKTHYAFFVTSKSVKSDFDKYYIAQGITAGAPSWLAPVTAPDDRKDGMSANDDCSNDLTKKGNDKAAKLNKIYLVSKERMDKPIQVVNFEYDNSLCRNLPNNSSVTNWPNPIANPITYNESGKLTLKKVWFEYEGVTKARISPYEFKYEYKASYPAEIASKYPDIANFGNYIGVSAQNPDYTPYALDMWGNHQYDGTNRKIKNNPWLYQGFMPDPTSPAYSAFGFDPAAWQLKQIILPSGGEIHIQYEQDDYRYVQDRDPMAMVSIDPSSSNLDGVAGINSSTFQNNNVYYLHTEDIGLEQTDPLYNSKLGMLAGKLINMYKGRDDKKIYFKFLYGLAGGVTGALNDCHSEYIKGYAYVEDVKVYSGTPSRIGITFGSENKEDSPKEDALRLVRTSKVGKVGGANCTNLFTTMDDMFSVLIESVPLTITGKPSNSNICYMRKKTKEILGNSTFNPSTFIEPVNVTQIGNFNPSLSYVKIPMLHAKRGGGVRVKRLLMYDNGIGSETGQAVLYGSEYIYKNDEGESSGVAANEPNAGREENALVGFLPRQKQTWFSKITTGEDHKEAEGPLGESVLPSPSVGYSKVSVINIHTGQTGTGYTVHEFYTAKDYPFDRMYNPPAGDVSGKGSDLTVLENNKKKDIMFLPAQLFNFKRNATWLTQGFRFIVNNMHGQVKSVSTYGGGNYVPPSAGNPGFYNLDGNLSSQQVSKYFEPGEQIKMLKYNRTTNAYTEYFDMPGKEMDISMEMQKVQDKSVDLSLEIDISIGLCTYPPVFLTAMPSISINDVEVSTHAMTKVIRYPAILKSTETFMDGARTISENIAFDPYTTNPVVVRTIDDYDGLKNNPSAPTVAHNGEIHNYNFPASWYYPEMMPKWEQASNKNQLKTNALSAVTYGKRGAYDPLNWPLANAGINNVVKASMTTYAKNNSPSSTTDPNTIAMQEDYAFAAVPFAKQNSINSRWLSKNTYLYKDENNVTSSIPTSSSPQNRNFKGGLFDIASTALPTAIDWTNGQLPTTPSYVNWIKTNSVQLYDLNGVALMEVNPLNIYSSAKYAYNYELPVAVAKNAQYANLLFFNFEDGDDYPAWNASAIVGSSVVNPHSGNKSLSFNNAQSGGSINLDGVTATANKASSLKVTQHLKDKGIWVKTWLKNNKFAVNGNPRIILNSGGTIHSMTNVAQTGEWTLFEAKIPASAFTGLGLGSNLDLFFKYDLAATENLFIDDFRVQPMDAAVTCFVYDKPSKRLVAQFDDQHFGVFYQYNEEGKLVRRMVETEKGLVTLTETQYNSPSKPR
jgi:hypothetical protein